MTTNVRKSTIEEILGGIKNTVSSVASAAGSTFTESPIATYSISIFYYIFLFLFVGFLALVVIHFTVMPIFRFKPGDKGYIKVPSKTDRFLYWNDHVQPAPLTMIPEAKDKASSYPFDNKFTVSVDVLVRKLGQTTPKNRVVLVKANRDKVNTWLQTAPMGNISNYMSDKASMIIYFDTNNDLNVTFFNGTTGTYESSRPLTNIPFYKPFRITVVVEEKIFTVYLDGKQAFQRAIPIGISNNSNDKSNGTETRQAFYAPPYWPGANEQPTIFHQNLMLWHRALQAPEVREASPALALESDFDVSEESDERSC
jgi:hypothetical protein